MQRDPSRVFFELTVDIAAPPDRVWTVMRSVEKWHEWTASVTSIRLLDSGPLRPGSRALVRQPRFPPARWTVTEVGARHFIWINRAPGLLVTARHSVEPAGNGSRATLSLNYEGIIGRLLARMTRRITERYLRMEGTGLKRRSEDVGRTS
jgi:hypothetical protein